MSSNPETNPPSQIASFTNFISSPTSLPPVKRYIISHSSETGKSVIHSSPALKYRGDTSVGGMARSYCSPGLPAKLKEDQDITAYLAEDGETSHATMGIVASNGTNLTVCEIAPSNCSQFHRTPSIDYVTVTHGRIFLDLDDGSSTELYPGDHVVQRGTMHRWRNASDTEPCRFIAVVVPAEPFEIVGKGMLKEEHVHGSENVEFDVKTL